MSIYTAYIVIGSLVALFVKIESILWNMRTPESMEIRTVQRQFITAKHETVTVYRRSNRLGQDLGTRWIKTKPSKKMLELAEFVGDRALMPNNMRLEVYGI